MVSSVTAGSSRTRTVLRIAAIALLLAGAAFVIVGIISLANYRPEPPSTTREPQPGPNVGALFLGAFLLFAGVALSFYAFLKPMSEYQARETRGAVQVMGGAVGRGLREGLGPSGPTGHSVVKIKCRACGFLESEDAKFCNNCRATI